MYNGDFDKTVYDGNYKEGIINNSSFDFVKIFDNFHNLGIKVYPTVATIHNYKSLSKRDLCKRGYVDDNGIFKNGHPKDPDKWNYELTRKYILENNTVSGYIPMYPFNKISVLDDDSHNKKNNVYDNDILKLVQNETNKDKNNLYQTTPGGGHHIIYPYYEDMINDQKYNGCIDRFSKNINDLNPYCILTGLCSGGEYKCNFNTPKVMSDEIKTIAKQPKNEVKDYYKYNAKKYDPKDMKYCYKPKDLKIIIDDECNKIFEALDVIKDNDIEHIVDDTIVWKCITALLRELAGHIYNIFDKDKATYIKNKIHKKWDSWSKYGSKYNKKRNKDIWLSSGNYNVNYNYIIVIANSFIENDKDHIKKYRTKIEYKPLNKNWEAITINEKYLNIGYKNGRNHILLKSAVKTGKTTLFLKLLKDLNKQCITITNSKPLNLQLYNDLCKVYCKENVFLIDSNDISKELNMLKKLISNYNNKSHIVICINSIGKLNQIENKINWNNTLLFIDEFNAFIDFLYTVDNKVMKNRTTIISKTIEYIQKVSYGLYVDNEITDIENLVLQNANINYDFYTNIYKSFQGVEVNILDKKQFDNYYSKCSENKENIMFCSNQKNIILAYYKILKGAYKYSDDEIKCIHSDSKDNFSGNREDLDDIIQFMFSPSITTGIEYNKKCKVFCYIKGMITISPLQVLQQIARARNPIEVNILFDNVINEYIKAPNLDKYKSLCNDENIFKQKVFDKAYAVIKDINSCKIDKSSFNHTNHNDILLNINFNKNVLNSDFKNNTLKLLSDKGYLVKTEDYDIDVDIDNIKDYVNFDENNIKKVLKEIDLSNDKDFDKFIIKYHNDDLQNIINKENKFIKLKNNFEILQLNLLLLYRLKTDDSDLYQFIKDIITKDNLKNHLMLCDFFKKNEIIKNDMEYLKLQELELNYNKVDKHNIIILKDILFKYLNEIFTNNDITTLHYDDNKDYKDIVIDLDNDLFTITKKIINRSIKEQPKTKKELMDFILLVFKNMIPNLLVKENKRLRINKIRTYINKITIDKEYLNKHLKLLSYRIEKGDDIKDKLYYKYENGIIDILKEIQANNINNLGIKEELKIDKINVLNQPDYEPDINYRCKECGRNINICKEIHNEINIINDNIRENTNYKGLDIQLLDFKQIDDNDTKLLITFIYGIDENGNNILCKVKGFKPFFYVSNDEDLNPEQFRDILNIDKCNDHFNIENVNKYNYSKYSKNKNKYLKISFYNIKMYNKIINILRLDRFKDRFQTFNYSTTPILQFIHQYNIKPSGWIKILSNDDIINTTDFKVIDRIDTAPIIILSYDIECYSSNYRFPLSHKDPIIQIGLTLNKLNDINNIEKYLISLGDCDDVEDSKIIICKTEKELLYTFKDLINKIKPHIFTGFNIYGFDNKYIDDRCKENKIDDFYYNLGYYNNFESKLIKKGFKNKLIKYEGDNNENNTFDNNKYIFNIEGIINIDLLDYYKSNDLEKFENYKLNTIAKVILNESKDDLTPENIFKKYEGNSYDRSIIAKYCIQDCLLLNKLFHKQGILNKNIAMSNVCKIPLSYMFSKGQSIRSLSLVVEHSNEKHKIIPDKTTSNVNNSYEGAIVLEPEPKLYIDEPIVVFDYGSLYPSSMIEKNISPDTFITEITDEMITDKDIEINEIIVSSIDITKKARFIKYKNGELGIIPSILQILLSKRAEAKIKMKEYDKTDNNYNYYDNLQLAYKLTANSIYGQCGAPTSQLYFKEVAEATTAIGRDRIELAKNYVENNYNANVIYGDTDSIFVRFNDLNINNFENDTELLKNSIEKGLLIENNIKEIMPYPQKLNYEKVLYPFAIFAKKRYIGNLYETDPNKYDIKCMGIVLKRRDNSKILKYIYGGIMDIILKEKDINKSLVFLEDQLYNLVNGKYQLDDLILSKRLKEGNYKNPDRIAHKVLADRVNKRKSGNVYQEGDRIEYIFIEKDDFKLQGERIETKEYILENNLKPDYKYYIENQLIKPIVAIYVLCYDKIPNSKNSQYWENIKIQLSKKAIYKDETKLNNKIISLKEKDIIDLLFSKYL